ncbi:MAG: hypothetical protein U9R37_06710 [Campylobacterota bacterium]|nr:hypothetical protein [Campylobacterota bacterium]
MKQFILLSLFIHQLLAQDKTKDLQFSDLLSIINDCTIVSKILKVNK